MRISECICNRIMMKKNIDFLTHLQEKLPLTEQVLFYSNFLSSTPPLNYTLSSRSPRSAIFFPFSTYSFCNAPSVVSPFLSNSSISIQFFISFLPIALLSVQKFSVYSAPFVGSRQGACVSSSFLLVLLYK